MKNTNKTVIIIAGALLVIGLVVYGSMSLYAKLNKVDKLNGRLEEAAVAEAGQKSVESTERTPEDDTTQTPEAEMTQTPEPVSSTQPKAVLEPSPTATLTPEPPSNLVDQDQKPEKESMGSEDKTRKKQKIDDSVTAELQQLKSSCQARSSSLAGQIARELGGDDEATLADIQSKYLSKIFSAEAGCDAKFNQLIGNAQSEYKAAGLGDLSLSDWSSKYESAKAQARADALAVIANSLN